MLGIASAVVGESQVEKAEVGMKGYWKRQAGIGDKRYLTNAGSPGLGAEHPVLGHKTWEHRSY